MFDRCSYFVGQISVHSYSQSAPVQGTCFSKRIAGDSILSSGYRVAICSIAVRFLRPLSLFTWLQIVLGISLAGIALPAMAQLDLNHDTGVKPQETYDQANENVNIAGGNLNIVIPLVHLTGRNGHDLNLTLAYNSQQWTPSASYVQDASNNNYLYVGWTQEQAWNFGGIPYLYFTGTTVFLASPGNNNSYSQYSCWQSFVLVMGMEQGIPFPIWPPIAGRQPRPGRAMVGLAYHRVPPMRPTLINRSNDSLAQMAFTRVNLSTVVAKEFYWI